MKQNPRNKEQHQTEENEAPLLKDNTDICQQLMDRYAKSSAPQHSHLLATAAAMRSILSSESLPLTPTAYFAAAISALTSQSIDPTAVSAALAFLSIVVPLVPPRGIAAAKASEAVGLLVRLVDREGEKLGMASLRCGVKCFGVLLVGFCDLEDWDSVRLGFESLLKFSIDKRPKVRRCAQEYLEKVFTSFQSSAVIKEASKLVYSLFKKYMPVAVTLSATRSVDGSKEDIMSKTEHVETLHLLNVLKLAIPNFSIKVSSKSLSELCKLMSSEFSPLTRKILKAIEVFFETSENEVIIPEMENIITSLTEYVSSGEKKPVDTLMSVATLLKNALDKLHAVESRSWIKNLPIVCGSLAGLLTSEASIASQASVIVKEVISRHINPKAFLIDGNLSFADDSEESEEANAINSTCTIFENTLSSFDGIPNEHILAVISVLFNKLGEFSYIFMRSIVLKLANLMTLASGDTSNTNHLQNCIGSAVMAMGLERMLALLPISLQADDLTLNVWLVPILKKHVVRASLGYYMEHIVPLAKSFQRASHRVKKSIIGQQLQVHAHGLWGLLPAFCRYPTDTHQKFGSLAELLITFLNKYSFMHESIAVALQLLVNQNKHILSSIKDAGESNTYTTEDSILEFGSLTSYSKKTATRNIRALASCSIELLQALIDIFVDSLPGTSSYLKDAIGCLASITDSSITTKILMSLLEKLKLINGEGEFESQGSQTYESTEKEEDGLSTTEKHSQRCVVMDLASCLVEGAKKNLVDLIYKFIRHTFQATNEIGHREAYHTLSRILEEHTWFCSSQFVELTDLLLCLKSPVEVASLRSRFACFHILMVHAFKTNSEEENEKAFLILNEIILTLKDSKEEPRKAAYDVLLMINTSLRSSSCVTSGALYQKLISMLMGYLSGSSPHIKSGAVSALSVLVYQDSDICLSMPDLVSSLLSLLQSKTVEVIKAVLGFTKVVVSSLQAKDLHNLLSDVVSGILPWSSVSRHHFRSKVTVILEIMTRKCGSAAVKSVAPEKYKGFIKTVLENRYVKTSSKESTTNSETVLADSSSKGPQKRKYKELGNLPEENGSVEHRKRKREKKPSSLSGSRNPHVFSAVDGGGLKSFKGARPFNQKSTLKVGSEGNRIKEKKDFIEESTGGRKRKMEILNIMKGQAGGDRPASDSKLRKQKK